MSGALIIITAFIACSGFGVAVWSVIQTRRFYYEEYISRKEKNQND